MKKYLISVLAMAAVSVPAFAQSYNVYTDNGMFVARGLATSGTSVVGVGIDPLKARSVRIYAVGSVAASATVTTELSDGSRLATVGTYAISTTPAEIVSFTALPPFAVVRVSTTTSLSGTNNVSLTIVQ